MELDELIREEIRSFRIPFDPAAEADAIRARVRRRHPRRWAAAIPVAIAATIAIGVAVVVLPRDHEPEHLTTDTSPTVASTTTTAPDPLAAAGVCRSLLPETGDPLVPMEPTSSDPGGYPEDPTHVSNDPDWRPQANTPCGLALAADLGERIPAGWEPWDDNPFDSPSISEQAPPNAYGTVNVSLVDADGVILQVRAGYGPPNDPVAAAGFGYPLDGLPEGWLGTTDFVPGQDRVGADVTVVRPGRVPVMVAVMLAKPGMGPPVPAGTVLPMGFEDVRALAIALALDGPVQSP